MGAFFKSCQQLARAGGGLAQGPRLPPIFQTPLRIGDTPPYPSTGSARAPQCRRIQAGVLWDLLKIGLLSCGREDATPADDWSTRAEGQCRIVTTTDCADCRGTWHHVNAVPSRPIDVKSFDLGTVMFSPTTQFAPIMCAPCPSRRRRT
jgi:hypothetical protein